MGPRQTYEGGQHCVTRCSNLLVARSSGHGPLVHDSRMSKSVHCVAVLLKESIPWCMVYGVCTDFVYYTPSVTFYKQCISVEHRDPPLSSNPTITAQRTAQHFTPPLNIGFFIPAPPETLASLAFLACSTPQRYVHAHF